MIENFYGQSVEVKADSNAYGTRILTLEIKVYTGLEKILRRSRMLSIVTSEPKEGSITCVVTGTEWQYLLNTLRTSKILPLEALGELIAAAMNDSEPKEFEQDDWHVPYYHGGFWQDAGEGKDLLGNTAAEAKDASASAIEDVIEYDGDPFAERFFNIFEHQATVMGLRAVDIDEDMNFSFSEGVTHFDRKGKSWSANFVDWLQWRQMGSLYD